MKERLIRVLELIDTREIGGGQIHVSELLSRLEREGFEATACAGPDSPFGRWLADRGAVAGGVPGIPVDVGGGAGVSALPRLRREIRARGFDLLHLHGGVAGMWGRLVGRFPGGPGIVCTYHGLHFFHKPGRARRRLIEAVERRLARRTDGAIFVSEHDRLRGIDSGILSPRSVAVIRNGIDAARYARRVDRAAVRGALGLPDRAVVVGAIGRLHPQKGLEDLLQAVRGAGARHPSLALLLAGDGPLRGALEARAAAYDLSDRVVFTGHRADVPDLLGALDLLLLPSRWEGLPLVLLEAMAAGTPVGASRIGGVTEVLVDGQNGRLFEPGRPAEIEAVIDAFFEAPGAFRAMAGRARQTVAEHFTVDRMVAETAAFLRRVHEARRGGGPWP